MKLKKILAVTIIFYSIIMAIHVSKAYTISLEDIKAKKGEEFTVNLKMDERTVFANGHIKFDSSKIEFIKASQENMNSAIANEGDLAWIYVDMNANGTNNFEFTFKVKENGESDLYFDDLAFVDYKSNEYTGSDILGNTKIKINKKSNIPNVAIIVIIIAIIVLIFYKKGISSRSLKESKKNK